MHLITKHRGLKGWKTQKLYSTLTLPLPTQKADDFVLSLTGLHYLISIDFEVTKCNVLTGPVGSIIYADLCGSIKIKLLILIRNIDQQRSLRIYADQFISILNRSAKICIDQHISLLIGIGINNVNLILIDLYGSA